MQWQSIISPIASALAIVADESGVFWQALSNSTFGQIRAAQAVGVSSPCTTRRYPRVKGSAQNRRHSKQLRRAISDCSQTCGDSGDRHVQRVQGALKPQLSPGSLGLGFTVCRRLVVFSNCWDRRGTRSMRPRLLPARIERSLRIPVRFSICSVESVLGLATKRHRRLLT